MVFGIPFSKAFSVLPGIYIPVFTENDVWDSFPQSILNTAGVIYPSFENEWCMEFLPLRHFQY